MHNASSAPTAIPRLTAAALSFSYGKQEIISRLSFDLTAGVPYLLTGESGRGKTTLLHIIAGLLAPTEGTLSGGGIGNVSLAFQDPRLFPTLTALENAALTGEVEAAGHMLRQFGFSDEDMLKTPDALSGGMQQRVSLVRAFLAKTPILLLDEPTRGLDSHLQALLGEWIREEAKNRIVLTVSHDSDDLARWHATEIAL